MKRKMAALTAAVLALSLAACGTGSTASQTGGASQEASSSVASSISQSAGSAEAESRTESAGPEADSAGTSSVSADAAATDSAAETGSTAGTDDSDFSQVLVDDENIHVEIKGIEHDSLWGYTWKMNLKNHTDKTLMYSMENVSVNGVMSDPFWAEEVAPGKEANSDVSWSTSDFEDNDIEQVTEVSFTLHVCDSETFETDYADQEFTVYPLGEDAVQNNTRETGENDLTLFENDQCAMRVTGVNPDGEWGYTLDVTLVNNTDQDVYFSVDSDPDYGEMSHQKLDYLEAGARIDVNEGKKNPYDFALWKKTDKGIQWDSPWGKGRPGWHTECVVMINKNLGDYIDIHGGGADLRFPHHENECAQQEALHHNTLANFWVHNAMININGQKMSKSLGNTLWAKDIVLKLGTNLTRWFMSSVHYRKELNFSDEAVETARKELDKVLNPLKQADIKAQLAGVTFSDAYDEESYRAFLDQLDDDLNTPNAYTVIFDTVKKINGALRQRDIDFETVGKLSRSVEKMLNVLGIVVDHPVLDEEARDLYTKWNDAKKNKDWAKADEYRTALTQKGIL